MESTAHRKWTSLLQVERVRGKVGMRTRIEHVGQPVSRGWGGFASTRVARYKVNMASKREDKSILHVGGEGCKSIHAVETKAKDKGCGSCGKVMRNWREDGAKEIRIGRGAGMWFLASILTNTLRLLVS